MGESQSEHPHGDQAKLTPEQKLFFRAAGEYSSSVTAQGIKLYLLCREQGIDFNDVFDQLMKHAGELSTLAQSIHQKVAGAQPEQSQHIANLKINENQFRAVMSAVIEVTEELFTAAKEGHPVPNEKLELFLTKYYPELMELRSNLRKKTQAAMAATDDQGQKAEMKAALGRTLSELEDKFNQAVKAEAQSKSTE